VKRFGKQFRPTNKKMRYLAKKKGIEAFVFCNTMVIFEDKKLCKRGE